MKKNIIITIAFIAIITTLPSVMAQPDSSPPIISLIYPLAGEEIKIATPEIQVEYSDESGIDIDSVKIIVDDTDVTDWDETIIFENMVIYSVPEIFKLTEGNHTIIVKVSDIYNNRAEEQWVFTINTTVPTSEEQPLDIFSIILYISVASCMAAVGFVLYILYLKKTKQFTFQKYFAQHPIQKKYIVVYLPTVVSFIFLLIGSAYVASNANASPYDYEYVIILGIWIAIVAYAFDSQFEKRKIGKFERSFSQFLFELADAVRGGLDPAKAVVELSKMDTGPMKKYLKIAADSIIIGRPFNDVMESMVKPMKSSLINRYASLVGEASQIGGETTMVIYRAAKDMDDMIKIDYERRRQLNWQSAIIYISFGVLLIIIYELIQLFPDIGSIDLGILSTNLEGETTRSLNPMSAITLKKRFFHLVMINAFGAGILIGEFTEGKVKYGLVHSLVMSMISLIFFVFLIF